MQLWKKSSTGNPNGLFQKYTTGTDYVLDLLLFPFDVQASIAHVKMLEKIGILKKEELLILLDGFQKLLKKYEAGNIQIRPEDEDCHTVIENEMVQLCGNVAKKIHTGRSRNDQVLTALRLYTIDKLNTIFDQIKTVLHSFLEFAETYQSVPFPGYTHTRQAMLSSLDHYALAYVELLLSDTEALTFAIQQTSKNPLGTGAGFGSSFALDRVMTTEELKFTDIQINSLSAQNSRGKYELYTMDALVQIMLTLGKFANDMIFFTGEETNYFTLDDAITTGSSMMPQKRNPDGFEIMRGYVGVVMGNQNMIQNICKNLLSGYNRDVQLLKKPLFESLDIVMESLQVLEISLQHLTPNIENIQQKLSSGIFAADIANNLVKEQNIPFRDAYKAAMAQLKNYTPDLQQNIASKVSLGAPGNVQLQWYRQKAQEV